jgi:hypothetical protein
MEPAWLLVVDARTEALLFGFVMMTEPRSLSTRKLLGEDQELALP